MEQCVQLSSHMPKAHHPEGFKSSLYATNIQAHEWSLQQEGFSPRAKNVLMLHI